MHTFEGEKTRFHFDSDFLSDLIIVNKENGEEIRINAEDILKLVLYEYILPKKK
jgi:hypothetical protein